MHVDHFIDLLALRFRLVRDLAGIEAAQRCTTLHLPPGGAAVLSAVLRAVSFREDFCTSAFQVQEYDPQQPLALGTLRAHFAPARHYIPAWAVRLEGGASLTYSGDTAPSAAVTDLARGSDLFLCEATLSKPEDGARRGHCTPAEAAAMARDAGGAPPAAHPLLVRDRPGGRGAPGADGLRGTAAGRPRRPPPPPLTPRSRRAGSTRPAGAKAAPAPSSALFVVY